MRAMQCSCGQAAFCDNTQCLACGRTLGFDPFTMAMKSVEGTVENGFHDDAGNRYQLCANRQRYGVCNGLVAAATNEPNALCGACKMNRTVPVVSRRKNIVRWRRLEQAKARLLAGLSSLGLQTGPGNGNLAGPMRFDFKEDKRSHPDVLEQFVSTGHYNGLITINLLEADDVQSVQQRERFGERYRTLLGHLRHETGHYFYPQLVTDTSAFFEVMGDPGLDYGWALQNYYDNGAPEDWADSFISSYASSHPLEDWAECFAHVLHIRATLETAAAFGLVDKDGLAAPFSEQLELWATLVTGVNEVSRSLGVQDAYPFGTSVRVAGKLEFVDATIANFVASQSWQTSPG